MPTIDNAKLTVCEFTQINQECNITKRRNTLNTYNTPGIYRTCYECAACMTHVNLKTWHQHSRGHHNVEVGPDGRLQFVSSSPIGLIIDSLSQRYSHCVGPLLFPDNYRVYEQYLFLEWVLTTRSSCVMTWAATGLPPTTITTSTRGNQCLTGP